MTLWDGLPHYWDEMLGRAQGPMKIRLLFQPVVAALFAIRAGLRDAREGRGLRFLSVFSDPAHRNRVLRDGWRDVGRVFLIAVAFDLVYEAVALRAFRPGEAAITGVVLAIVPYLLFRSLVNRVLGTE
jgi:hypothetical protein